MKCNCPNKQQDEMYGPQMRVHNKCKTKGATPTYVCTVCGKKK